MAKKIDPREIGKKGGEARAKTLSPHRRAEIARNAATARWSKASEETDLPKALCGGKEPLRIGDLEIPCYVLEEDAVPEDEDRRVIRVDGMQSAIGMAPGGGTTRLVDFALRISDNPSMASDLSARLSNPIEFTPPNGGLAKGYSCMLLQQLCDAVLEARQAGRLSARQAHIADAAEVLIRGFAAVGIVALIDEATGYQEVRKRLALAAILDKYLDDNLNQWSKTFPDEFYEQFFRLKGWDYENMRAGDIKPKEVGRFTRDEVYRRLHPGIIQELEERNPYVVPGRRMHKHHQWLSKEVGHSALEKHIAQIIVVMKLSSDWQQFMSQLQQVLPVANSDTGYFGFVSENG